MINILLHQRLFHSFLIKRKKKFKIKPSTLAASVTFKSFFKKKFQQTIKYEPELFLYSSCLKGR